MPELDESGSAALRAILDAIADPERILHFWRANDVFPEKGQNGVRLLLGGSRSPDVGVVAERYERAVGRPFPALLRALLSKHDGFDVEATSDGRITVVEGVGRHVSDGLLPAARIETEETSDFAYSGLRFATAYGQCRLILVDEGERTGAVFFDDREIIKEIAPSLAVFLHELAEKGLSIEAVMASKY